MSEDPFKKKFPEFGFSEREQIEQDAARIIEANKNRYGREGLQDLLKHDSELDQAWTEQGYTVPFFSGLDQDGNMIKIMAQPEEHDARDDQMPDSLVKVLYGDEQRDITIPGQLRTHDLNFRDGSPGYRTLYDYEGMIAGFQRAALEEDVASEEIARFGALKQQIDGNKDMQWLREKFGNQLRGLLRPDHQPEAERVSGEVYSAYLVTEDDNRDNVSAVSLAEISERYTAEDRAALATEQQQRVDYEQAWQMHERATAHVNATVKKGLFNIFESAEKFRKRQDDAFRESMDEQSKGDRQ